MNVFDHKKIPNFRKSSYLSYWSCRAIGFKYVNGFLKMGSKVIATDSNIKKLKEYSISKFLGS